MNESRTIDTARRILDAWLPYKGRFDDLPSIVVGVTKGNRVVYRRGFGFAHRARRVPSTPRTQYRIASISKVFTAIAILQLVGARKLRLSDRISRHVPWFSSPRRRAPTLLELLSHRSGIWRDGDTPHWADDRFPDAAVLRRRGLTAARVYPAGLRFKYSNYGYALLGLAIERAGGMSYEAYVERNVLRPLGMWDTRVDHTGPSARLARGYGRRDLDGIRDTVPHSRTKAYAPATGFLSTVDDLCRLVAALGTGAGSRFLPAGGTKGLRTRRWPVGHSGAAYGLGLDSRLVGSKRVFGHGGGFAGFTTSIGFEPTSRLGVVVLTNATGAAVGPIRDGIFELLFHLQRYPRERLRRRTRKHWREGLYSSRWEDRVLTAVGNGYIAIEPGTNAPAKSPFIESTRSGRLVLRRTDERDEHGEAVRFVRSKAATTMYWGPTPMEKSM